jgi:hypothetical protein
VTLKLTYSLQASAFLKYCERTKRWNDASILTIRTKVNKPAHKLNKERFPVNSLLSYSIIGLISLLSVVALLVEVVY